MFDNDSFVSRPPAVIKARQRLCLEAISFSINTIVRSLHIVKNIVNGHSIVLPNIADFSTADKIPLCSNLWAIVGQTHMLIKLLKELDCKSPVIDRFISLYSVTSKMLNKIDHIHSNMDNIMNSSKSRPTIFGSLSYFVSNNTMRNDTGKR
jgi:hypothetical protein